MKCLSSSRDIHTITWKYKTYAWRDIWHGILYITTNGIRKKKENKTHTHCQIIIDNLQSKTKFHATQLSLWVHCQKRVALHVYRWRTHRILCLETAEVSSKGEYIKQLRWIERLDMDSQVGGKMNGWMNRVICICMHTFTHTYTHSYVHTCILEWLMKYNRKGRLRFCRVTHGTSYSNKK